MKHWISGLTGLVLLSAASALMAQDLFRSTGSTTRSYNYIEVQYLPEVDADPPILATLSLDVTDSWSFRAEYLNQNFSESGDGVSVDLDAELYSVGAQYHAPLGNIRDSDIVLGVAVGRVTVRLRDSLGIFDLEDSSSFQEAYVGMRRTATDRVEAELGLTINRQDGDTDVYGDAKVVFRVRPSIDVALAVNEIGESDLFGVGLRYTWN